MGKKLAIKGHSTRGKEVIELLEMLGGKVGGANGFDESAIYVIPVNGIIDVRYTYEKRIDDYAIFTLEEFLAKYPFKVGDKVNQPCRGCVKTITSMKWDEYLNTVSYKLDNKIYTRIEQLKVVNDLPHKEINMKDKEDKLFDSIIWHLRNSINNGKQNLSGGECEEYFRKVVKKNNENKMKNVLAELLEHIKTTPKEELEREFEEIEEWSHVGPTVEEFMDFCNKVNKKLEYPKTYEECAEKINACPIVSISYDSDEDMLYNDEADLTLLTLRKLLICRDAYWKIAGEQMGLGKPWEPDWKDDNDKYFICYIKDELWMSTIRNYNRLLVFPTEEMRDVFCENFMNLIEQCKELL